MTALFPTDTSWEIVQRSIEYWYSTRNFSKHISALIAKVDVHTDPNTTPVTDDNVVEIAQLLEHMKERDSKVKLIIDYILRHVFGLDATRLMKYVKEYDRDKLDPDKIALFAHYDATHPEEEPDFVVEHHLNSPHHIEHWKKLKDDSANLEIHDSYGPNSEQAIKNVI